MSSIDSLLKRAKTLTGNASTERYEQEWQNLCAGARDRLMAKLQRQMTWHPEEEVHETTAEDQAMFANIKAWLHERSAEASQAFIQQRRSGWRS